jgi:uncharacterized protein YceK
MAKAATYIVLAVCVVSLSGCGTFANLVVVSPDTGEKKVYGGVMQDFKAVGCNVKDAWASDSGSGWLSNCFAVGFLAIDTPVSAVADTMTLPLTIAAALQKPTPEPGQQPASPVAGQHSGP